MVFERIKKASMKAAMSPTAMKLLSDPRIQKVMMKAIQLPGEVRQTLEKNGQNIAEVLSLVTKEELSSMRRTIRDLQSEIESLRNELAYEQSIKTPTQTSTPAVTTAPAKKKIAVKRKGAESTSSSGKKKIAVKRKASSEKTQSAKPNGSKGTKKVSVKRKVAVKRKK